MKKTAMKIMAIVLCAVMLLSFAACGGKTKTVSDYINSKDFQTELNDMKSSLEGSGMDIDVTAEGNTLVMTYTMDMSALGVDEVTEEDKAALGESLSSALGGASDTFVELADELAGEGVENPVVRVTYKLSDGSVLASEDFPASK